MVTRRPAGKKPHYHGCRTCHHRYEDTCEQSTENGHCVICRGGRGYRELRENAMPHDCCLVHARLPSKDERVTYRLAGNSIWFICGECKRCHPYDDPKTTTKEYS